MTLGEYLKKFRLEYKNAPFNKVHFFAPKLGITAQQLYNLESDRYEPSLAVYKRYIELGADGSVFLSLVKNKESIR